jgi:hypothetical protein
VATVSGKEERKGWPMWPALLLEHFKIIAADEAKEKGEKDTVCVSFQGMLHLLLTSPVHLYLRV